MEWPFDADISDPCFECGMVAEYDHHVVPRSRGGTGTVRLCGSCHALAHHRSKNMNTSALTKDAFARKRENNEKCGGQSPYGWEVGPDGVHMIPNTEEQEAINKAIELRKSGLSLRKVGAKLSSLGMHPRTGKSWHAKTVRSLVRPWHHQTVKNLINSRLAD